MDATPASAIVGAGKQLGRYFSLVNGLSSLLVLGVPLLLILAGAPQRAPDLRYAMGTLGGYDVVQIAALGIAGYAIGFLIHPLQFASTQLLEGYWGTSRWAQAAMTRSIKRKLGKWYLLHQIIDEARKHSASIDVKLEALQAVVPNNDRRGYRLDSRPLIEDRVQYLVAEQEGRRIAQSLPNRPDEIMPTDLGNVLRRFERLAGQPFGLDGVIAAPYLAQVAEARELDYLDDARSSLDLSVRMVLVWSLTTVTSLCLLWRHRAWVVVPVSAFSFAVLSYRGAVAAAARYGNALVVVTALGKDHLYARLGIAHPSNIEDEIHLNGALNQVLAGYPAKIWYSTQEFRKS